MMSKIPVFSVIVPVYNTEKKLERCLDSIKRQTYDNYEVILIDDGSKDNSGVICDRYASYDSRFKVIHTKNQGVSFARNIGLEEASGKYVMFVDSDDFIMSDMFEVFANTIHNSELDIIIGGAYVHERDKKESVKMPPILGKCDNSIWNAICLAPNIFGYVWGKAFKTVVIKDNTIKFNINMYAQEDLDFNLSVYEKCANFEIIDYAGYKYEYIPGKRKPPVWDFIKNSLKMYRIGSQKIDLSSEAQNAIKERVVSQIFSFLYNCTDIEGYKFAINKLEKIEGLNGYLRSQKITGESKYIIKWYLAQKYERIYKYFSLRKMIKRMMGLPVSE